MTDKNYLKKLADMQTQIKELVPDSENGERRMNKSEAIEILEEVKILDDSIYQYSKAYLEALDVAIGALKVDAIPINWIKAVLNERHKVIEDKSNSEERIRYYEEVEDAINELLIWWAERKEE